MALEMLDLTYLTFGMLIFGSATGLQILVARRKGEMTNCN